MERFLPSIVERLDTSLQLPYVAAVEQSTNEDLEDSDPRDDAEFDYKYG